MTITTTNPNGVNVAALLAAREALSATPAAAGFQGRARCEWVNGTHSRTTVEDFFGLGAEQSHRTRSVLETDHPELFAAEDNGVTPVEMVLAGLAGCLVGGVATVAANRGITLRSVRATVTGDQDLQGILGIDTEVRNGYGQVRVHFDIESDATPEQIAAVVAQSQKRSAVYDAMTNPTNVVVTVN